MLHNSKMEIKDLYQLFLQHPFIKTDTRKLVKGDLFFALKGPNFNGNLFADLALESGASYVIADEPGLTGEKIIDTDDVLSTLQKLAKFHRQQFSNVPFIAITGSNGKTSTKEATAAVLSRQAPTLKTFASYNNEVGYPLTLLRLEPQHRYAVLEMGAQWVGELAWLSNTIARPDWSIITNVGAAHLEYFGSQERVAVAKSELVKVLTPQGIAILNYDDPYVRNMAAQTDARVLFYGLGEGAEVCGSDIAGDTLGGRSLTLHYNGQQKRVQLHIPGSEWLLHRGRLRKHRRAPRKSHSRLGLSPFFRGLACSPGAGAGIQLR